MPDFFVPAAAVSYPIDTGHGGWIQVVKGKLHVAGLTLTSGDGVGITDVNRLELHFEDEGEVLLFDVRMDVPLLWT